MEKSSKEDVGTAGEKSLKEDTTIKKIGNISKIGATLWSMLLVLMNLMASPGRMQ